MDLGLEDARVVVVGASRGMGRGAARKFAGEGARLALIARSRKGLEKTADQCRAAGSPEVIVLEADISSKVAIDAAFAELGRSWGHINALVNIAANSIGTHGPFEQFADEAVYVEAFGRITLGYARTTRAALPFLKRAQWARIVNISTASTSHPAPFLHVYNMTKSAVVSMSTAQAKEFAPLGISVNVMSPAGIMVEGGNWGEVMNGYFAKAGLDPADPASPVKLAKIQFGSDSAWLDRYGGIEEYATVIAFLASKANSYMTGANVNVDGGSYF